MIFSKKYIYYISLFIKSFFKYLFNKNEKPVIDFLEIWVGTRCTLKCKYCMHLIPYLSNKEFYKIDDIINDLGYILENVKVKTLSIAGGEPFLHPELYKLINYISQREDINLCHIMTNATVEPKGKIQETLLNLDKKFLIRIARYKGKEDLQSKFIDFVEKNKINNELRWSYTGEDSWWMIALPGHKKIGIEKANKIYKTCCVDWCTSLANGLLSTCTRGISLDEIFHQKANFFENIYVRKIKFQPVLKALICTCMQKEYYKDCCRYCLGINSDTACRIPEGKEQLK